MKKPWEAPPGCECNPLTPAKYRCSAQWMRCRGRVAYEMRVTGFPLIVKLPQKRSQRKAISDETSR